MDYEKIARHLAKQIVAKKLESKRKALTFTLLNRLPFDMSIATLKDRVSDSMQLHYDNMDSMVNEILIDLDNKL